MQFALMHIYRGVWHCIQSHPQWLERKWAGNCCCQNIERYQWTYMHIFITSVLVLTTTGVFSVNELSSMVEESLKMAKFNHPNVMRLVGVCIDGGGSPYIVMPFMTHGSLLSYLRKHRAELTIANNDNSELVRVSMHKSTIAPYAYTILLQ